MRNTIYCCSIRYCDLKNMHGNTLFAGANTLIYDSVSNNNMVDSIIHKR